MKAVRIVVLSVAIAAGGVAALLAGRSEPSPAATQDPTAKIPTADLELAPDQAETLNLRSMTDSYPKSPYAADDSEKPGSRRSGVKLVRFGITTTTTLK